MQYTENIMLSMGEKQMILREKECIMEKSVLQKGKLGKQTNYFSEFISTSQN